MARAGRGPTLRRRWRAGILCAVALALSGGAATPFSPIGALVLTGAPNGCATPGQDGPGGTIGGVVNTYYPGTADAAPGDTAISVGAPSGSATPIGAGDLLLVIQMQSASIDSTNTNAYGHGVPGDPASGWTALNGAGQYEYVAATGPVVGGMVAIAGSGGGGGLLHSFTTAAATATQGQQAFQVVRVPQYSSVTLASTLTARAWNGADGGILALDVAGQTDLGSAAVSVDSTGFRGGAGIQHTGSPTPTGTDYRNLSTYAAHGQKGEGVAGTPALVWDAVVGAVVTTGQANDGYPNGSSARGAPGTAGGGGTDPHPSVNDENSGGGGGGNGGAGGLGGNSWKSNLVEGGFGGAAYPASATQLTLGGGGGAGSRNNSPGMLGVSSGGTGGGLVLIRTGSFSGVGTISADGGSGPPPANDGGGGGGGGGSVLVASASGTLSGLTVHADGGAGANAWASQPPGAGNINAHGPGGGGAGGVVVTSSAPSSQTVTGGPNGTTTTAQLAYNAQPGGAGVTSTSTISSSPGVMAGAVCLPALTVTKTTSTPTVVQTPSGTTATFTVTVANGSGLGTALGAQISDALPSGFDYATTGALVLSGGATRTAVIDPSAGDTTPVFGTFSIPGGGSVAVTFTVNIASSVILGAYQNTGTVTYADPQRTSPSGSLVVASAPVTVNVIAAPDMVITKSHVGTFTAGQSGTYTLTASNAGNAPTTGLVTVSDDLPNGLMPTAAAGSGWACSISGQTVTCTRSDSLPAGQSYPAITVTVSVAAAAVPSVTNTATVSGGGELDTSNDSASDPTTVSPSADVSIVKTHNGTFVVGQTGTYTLAVANAGPSPSGQLTVTDALPVSLTYVSATGSGWSCVASGQNVTCTDSAGLASGGTSNITLTVSVGAGAAGGVTNTAAVESATSDPNLVNNSSTDSTTAPSADVSIVKSHSGTFTVGQTGSYTLAVANAGPSASGVLTVSDMLPAGLTYVSASGINWSCSASGQAVTCTNASGLASGGSTSIGLVVAVGATAAPSITNAAGVTSTAYDSDTANNNSSDTAAVRAVDLRLVKQAVGTFSAGGQGTYDIVVTNVGNAATFGPTTVSDTLPTLLSYVSATGPGWICSVSAQTVTCVDQGVIAAQASSTITLVVDIASTATGSIVNVASVATIGDVSALNNNGSAITALDSSTQQTAPSPPAPASGVGLRANLELALPLLLGGAALLLVSVWRRREPGQRKTG